MWDEENPEKYKIGEFCQLLGISADTLRYYERRKILKTEKDPHSSYRLFRKENAPYIWNTLMLRSIDMGIEEMRHFYVKGGLEKQLDWLRACEQSLAEKITKLECKRKRLLRLADMYTQVAGTLGKVSFYEPAEGNHFLCVLGDGCHPSQNILQAMPQWVAAMPFTYVVLRIMEEDLLAADEPLRVHVGLGITEGDVPLAEVALPAEAVYAPGGKTLWITYETKNVFNISRDTLMPIFAEAKARHFRATGPVLGRVLYTTYSAGEPTFVVVLFVSVTPE